eukprot:GHRQ01022339.1.p2 GENE.GHRQ01022339.1~~GHRQ01022339.1.p2  ORF type:complete len:122 (-),score=10.44 GHRQ01022339.1:916-1245(-)
MELASDHTVRYLCTDKPPIHAKSHPPTHSIAPCCSMPAENAGIAGCTFGTFEVDIREPLDALQLANVKHVALGAPAQQPSSEARKMHRQLPVPSNNMTRAPAQVLEHTT